MLLILSYITSCVSIRRSTENWQGEVWRGKNGPPYWRVARACATLNSMTSSTPIPLWASWNLEPLTLLVIAGVTGAYLYALGPLRRRLGDAAPLRRSQPVYFFVGMGLLALAVFSPLETLGMEYSLTMHMVQHLIFSVVTPPLLWLGTPGWMLTALFRGPRARRVTRWLTHPVVAFGLYNANMWLWHIPPVFDATPGATVVEVTWLVENLVVGAVALILVLALAPRCAAWLSARLTGGRGAAREAVVEAGGSTAGSTDDVERRGMSLALMAVGVLAVIGLTAWGALNVSALTPVGTLTRAHNPLHLVMNLMFVGTAILYWAPLLSSAPEVAKRITPLFGMLYLFISTQPMMALGALLTFASQPLYYVYDSAPLIWGFTRLGDQQLAGLTMWLLMDAPLLGGLSILFFRWVNQMDRAERLAAGEDVEPATAPEQDLIWESVGGTDGR